MIDGALPVARALHFAASLILEGSLAFQLWVAPPVFGRHLPIPSGRRWTDILAVPIALLSGLLWVGLVGADLAGASLLTAFSEGSDWVLLTQTLAGEVWIARAVGLVLLGVWLLLRRTQGREPSTAALILSALLCGSLAWAGHGAATPGYAGVLHTAADFIHLVAAGVWVGGLLPFTAMLVQARRGTLNLTTAHAAAQRFGTVAFVSVAFLLLTGIVNTWMMLRSIADLFDTVYGLLLLVKIALFILMLLFATLNRLVLTPRMASSGSAAKRAATRLGIHAGCEFVLSLMIIGVVGALGILEPG